MMLAMNSAVPTPLRCLLGTRIRQIATPSKSANYLFRLFSQRREKLVLKLGLRKNDSFGKIGADALMVIVRSKKAEADLTGLLKIAERLESLGSFLRKRAAVAQTFLDIVPAEGAYRLSSLFLWITGAITGIACILSPFVKGAWKVALQSCGLMTISLLFGLVFGTLECLVDEAIKHMPRNMEKFKVDDLLSINGQIKEMLKPALN